LRQQRDAPHQEQDRPTTNAGGHAELLRRAEIRGRTLVRLCQPLHQTREEAVRRILGVNLLEVMASLPPMSCAIGLKPARAIITSFELSGTQPPMPLSLRQVDPLIRQLTLYPPHRKPNQKHLKTGESIMNLIELDRALRQLRLGAWLRFSKPAARHKPKPMPPIDLIGVFGFANSLYALTVLLQRRRKKAAFRDADGSCQRSFET